MPDRAFAVTFYLAKYCLCWYGRRLIANLLVGECHSLLKVVSDLYTRLQIFADVSDFQQVLLELQQGMVLLALVF